MGPGAMNIFDVSYPVFAISIAVMLSTEYSKALWEDFNTAVAAPRIPNLLSVVCNTNAYGGLV